jgi:hypothetical protein
MRPDEILIFAFKPDKYSWAKSGVDENKGWY